jgi:hypothetical protein
MTASKKSGVLLSLLCGEEVKAYQGQKSSYWLSAWYGHIVWTQQNICNWIENCKTGCMNVRLRMGSILTVFWDSQGLILVHYVEGGLNSKQCSLLCNAVGKLKPEICSRHWRLQLAVVVFLPDNAYTQLAAWTFETVQQLKFEVLQHSTYGVDLTPLAYHLFCPLKNTLRDHRYAINQAVD